MKEDYYFCLEFFEDHDQNHQPKYDVYQDETFCRAGYLIHHCGALSLLITRCTTYLKIHFITSKK